MFYLLVFVNLCNVHCVLLILFVDCAVLVFAMLLFSCFFVGGD